MTVPLISFELFDFLRNQKIEPYSRLDDLSRTKLSAGVRPVAISAGDTYVTRQADQRVTVLSGRVRILGDGRLLDVDNTRNRAVLTQPGDNALCAEEDSVLLMADLAFLDTLSSWTELAAYVRDSQGEELANRLLRVTHSIAFRCLPLEHVEDALKRMKPQLVKEGETVITQGEPGDTFYLLWSGRAEVWRTDIYDDEPRKVAVLGVGDTFGDEALVIGGTRNATVKMVEDGKLLVLDGTYFRELISRPLLREVSPEEAKEMLASGWTPVDVRYAEELEEGVITGSLHLPLPDLRSRAHALDKNGKHVVICRSGKRSAVGAFLLNQRGFEAVSLRGGLLAWQEQS